MENISYFYNIIQNTHIKMDVKRNPKAPANRKGWSTADDTTLIKMARGGATAPEIAKILGRTIMAVTNRKYTLNVDVRLASSKGKENSAPKSLTQNKKKKPAKRVEMPFRVISRTPLSAIAITDGKNLWTPADDTQLILLANSKVKVKEIAKTLGRTPAAVTFRKAFLKRKAAVDKSSANETPKFASLLDEVLNKPEAPVTEKAKRGRKVGYRKVKENKQDSVTTSVNAYQSASDEFAAMKAIARKYGATITITINS
jgi:predicted transcriptional regulator